MHSFPPPPDAGPSDSATTRSAWRSTLAAIAVDAGPPLLIFFVLHACGVGDVVAYTAGSVVPLVRLIADRWRGRPFNVISGLVVVFLVVSVALAVVTDDARAVIARGGLIYLALAVAAAVSIPTRSPAMLLLSRYVAVRARPETATRFDETFRRPSALRAMRMVTAVWALGFAICALACVVCAYTLPVTEAATATSLVEPVTAMILAGGTARYMRRALAGSPLTESAADPPQDRAGSPDAPTSRAARKG
ncbi:VC0807 family protein [Streptomyces sp. NPDC007901]|uniref:VC0807 family protein n=1 Tax=Streptomyces sp. NPDC007901 TaxID=3364785 RepID=UPI0036E1B3F9